MNPLPPNSASSDDAIETAAVEWLCERDAGFAPGRAQAFAAWRAADARHEAAFAETERAMELLAEMPEVRAPLEARITTVAGPVAPVVRWGGFRPPVWAAGLAAALVLAKNAPRPLAGSIGPQTSETMKKVGMPVDFAAKTPSLDALVEALVKKLKG